MKPIGGYFELEKNFEGDVYHKDAIELNTGRNALEYLLLVNRYTKVFIPSYSCSALLEPLIKYNIPYEFYAINEDLESLFDFHSIANSEAFLYINYFGLKDKYIKKLTGLVKNLIIDNVQSFYSYREEQTDTFYSARKFFGVPDGAYLYSTKILNISIEMADSSQRTDHLYRRLQEGPEAGFEMYKRNEDRLAGLPLQLMSPFSKSALGSIDYYTCAEKRKQNFAFLHSQLGNKNRFVALWDGKQIPMNYPFWSNIPELREYLLKHRIYCPVYWPSLTKHTSLEKALINQVVFIPVDQRYSVSDMQQISSLILNI